MAAASLTLPKFGRRVRICAVHVVSTAQLITLSVVDGSGTIALNFECQGAIYATFAVGSFSVSNNQIQSIPPDLIIEETDNVTLSAAAAVTSDVVVSYEVLDD